MLVFEIKLYIELSLVETMAYIAKSTTPCPRHITPLPRGADLERFGDATLIVPHDTADDYMNLTAILPTDLQEHGLTMHGGDGSSTSSVLMEARRAAAATP